jgi:hypothetical protein
MLFFKEWYKQIAEGANEDQALAILQNDQNTLNQLKTISPEPKYLPALAFFYLQHKDLNALQQYFTKLQELVNKRRINYQPLGNGVKINNDIADNWLKFTEIIDGLTNLQQKKTGKNDATPIDAKPIFHNDRIDVYEANSPQACVKYGQGYSFCISKPGNTMWQSYRDTQTSTFYFVFDRARDKSDPLHIVVFDMTINGPLLTDANNKTGTIAKFGKNAEAYLDHLQSLGVPIELFKNIAKSPEEKEEHSKLGKENKDLAWFKQLSHDYKSKYIGRGHVLTNEQFDLLWNNRIMDLLNQYVNIGSRLNDYQMDKVFTNNNLKNSYLRQRLIANDHTNDLNRKEFDQLSIEQQQKVKNRILSMDKEDALKLAAGNGHKDIVELLIAHDFPSYVYLINGAMVAAAGNGYKDIVELLIAHGANNFNGAMEVAARNGHKDIVELLIAHGANDFNGAMEVAARNGHKDIIELLIAHGANDFDSAISAAAVAAAAGNGHKDLFMFLYNLANPTVQWR